jgi:hypothetical protein
LVKKVTSFVQKNQWGSSTKQNDLMLCSKTHQKRHHECNNKTTAKCVSIEKLKAKKAKKERSKNTPQI